MDRQALHCHQLTFEHPYTKEMLSLESSLPDDFLKGCQQ
jgi:23S rRNA-/tRNA-specific pseudouridylate synthase